jgi:zinc transport system ATP-binding protein
MSVLTITNLNFAYGQQNILENINLSVEQNDFLAIIGPNGGGKSTLLKLILALCEDNSNSIKLFGNSPVNSLHYMGYVPQNTNINIDFPITVIEVVLMGHIDNICEVNYKPNFLQKIFSFGYRKAEVECALEALKQVGMEKFAYSKIGSLSGGQRQRVMIARALCANPKILLLDEPTASIDVDGQRQVYDLLKKLNKSITIIVVSHDISVILGYANKVAHINKTLTFHDISHKKDIPTNVDEHFCEVEMLELLGSEYAHGKCCKC